MIARPRRVLLLIDIPQIRQQVASATEAVGLANVLCASDADLFNGIEAARPRLVCLQFDGHSAADVARVQLMMDLYPRLSILLIQAQSSAAPPPAEWMGHLAGHIDPSGASEQLISSVSWSLCADASKPQRTPTDAPFLVGRSQIMLQVFDAINRMAESSQPILIQGEHGTGKHLAAVALHSRSSRCDLHIHTLDCSEIDENVLEQLLFGPSEHSTLPPMLQDEQIGTIVLAELASISPALQSRLIDWIRQREADRSHPCVIFTTSRDLGRLVANRKVRADLFLELSNQVIGLPPLRHRTTDIRILVDHFRQYINNYLDHLQKPPLTLEPEHYQALDRYHWPFNVRELRATLISLALDSLAPAAVIARTSEAENSKTGFRRTLTTKLQMLFDQPPAEISEARIQAVNRPDLDRSRIETMDRMEDTFVLDRSFAESTALVSSDILTTATNYWGPVVERFAADESPNIYARALTLFEKELLQHVLERTGGDLEDSARLLGISHLSLQKKIQQLEIKVPDLRVMD